MKNIFAILLLFQISSFSFSQSIDIEDLKITEKSPLVNNFYIYTIPITKTESKSGDDLLDKEKVFKFWDKPFIDNYFSPNYGYETKKELLSYLKKCFISNFLTNIEKQFYDYDQVVFQSKDMLFHLGYEDLIYTPTIFILSSNVPKLKYNIRIGMKFEEVIAIFGKPNLKTGKWNSYRFDFVNEISFKVEYGKVTQIYFRRIFGRD